MAGQEKRCTYITVVRLSLVVVLRIRKRVENNNTLTLLFTLPLGDDEFDLDGL